MARGGSNTRPPGSVADFVGSSGNREGPLANPKNCPIGPPVQWVCAAYSDFAGSVGIMRKRGLLGAAGRNTQPAGSVADFVGSSGNLEGPLANPKNCPIGPPPRTVGMRRLLGFRWVCRDYAKTGPSWRGGAKYATRRIRGRLRGIFRKSRDSPATVRNCHMLPARRVCAICSDFSGSVGIMRKRGLLGTAGRNTRPAGSVTDCVGSSRDRAISRRISETSTWPRAVGLRHLHGFLWICRNYAKTGRTWRGVRNTQPPIRGRLRRIVGKSRDPAPNLRNLHMGPARWVCAIYSDFSGFVGVRRKRGVLCAGGGTKYETARIRCRFRRIFRKSRDSSANPRRFPMAPARWVFAIYSDFS